MISAFSANSAMVCLPVRCPISLIERELAAELLERLDEAVRLREARHRRGLGDLEADLRAVEPAAMELVDDERQELVIPQALSREVDGAQQELLALVGIGHQPA